MQTCFSCDPTPPIQLTQSTRSLFLFFLFYFLFYNRQTPELFPVEISEWLESISPANVPELANLHIITLSWVWEKKVNLKEEEEESVDVSVAFDSSFFIFFFENIFPAKLWIWEKVSDVANFLVRHLPGNEWKFEWESRPFFSLFLFFIWFLSNSLEKYFKTHFHRVGLQVHVGAWKMLAKTITKKVKKKKEKKKWESQDCRGPTDQRWDKRKR